MGKVILIVDDEVDFSRALALALGTLEMKSVHATSLADADVALKTQDPCLILLDRMLPDGDGATWLERRRKQGLGTPVILLTAKGQLHDRIQGLEAGADDYLPKPFSLDELSARIKAVLRRTGEPVELKAWEINPKISSIRGPSGWVKLTRLEFRLASELIKEANSILSREELLKEVWGFQWVPQTRTVDYFMGRLRKKFEKNPDQPMHFLTHRGLGFEFRR